MPNAGRWTDARFHSFIKSALRAASNRWPPKYETKKKAWRERGTYLCAGFNRSHHKVPVSYVDPAGRRRANVFVDHIEPVIDPVKGFVSWDELISRMFVEADGLQVLCKECHDLKTAEERSIRKDNK